MKAYQLGDQKGLQSLVLIDKPPPQCGPGQVVLQVAAACLNNRDLQVISGRFGPPSPQDRIPGSDGVGVVMAVGKGVSHVRPGDRATCVHFVTWLDGAFSSQMFAADLGISLDGWLAEQILLPGAALVKVPDIVSDAQAAPLASAGVTAWNTVVEFGQVKAGDLVLALGTGGVSMFALQIAKLHGAQTAVTSSSEAKLAKARALGVDFTVNYLERADWAAALMEQTGQAGADIIVETGGGATLPQSLIAAAANGRIGLIGGLGGGFGGEIANLGAMVFKTLTLRGMVVGHRRMLEDLLGAVATSGMTPPVDRVFPFAETQAAYAHLQSGEHLGKVMIKF